MKRKGSSRNKTKNEKISLSMSSLSSSSPSRPAKRKRRTLINATKRNYDCDGNNDNADNSSSSVSPPVINVGDVGYTFRKQFDDGWYTGRVVKIRIGAAGGYDRRCYYEDGDSEDLTLTQLQTLALLDPEVTKKKARNTTATATTKHHNEDTQVTKKKARNTIAAANTTHHNEDPQVTKKKARNTTTSATRKHHNESAASNSNCKPLGSSSDDDDDDEDSPLSSSRRTSSRTSSIPDKNVATKNTTTKSRTPLEPTKTKTNSSDNDEDFVPLSSSRRNNNHKRVYKKSKQYRLPMRKYKPENNEVESAATAAAAERPLKRKAIDITADGATTTTTGQTNGGEGSIESNNDMGVRRSGRTVKAPRKVDEIYSYEHIKLSYANYYAAKKNNKLSATSSSSSNRGEIASNITNNNSNNELLPSTTTSAEKKARLLSSTLDEIIPLDMAAESTLLNSNNTDKGENYFGGCNSNTQTTNEKKNEKKDYEGLEDMDDEEDKWLEKVAVSLGADASAYPPQRKNMMRASTSNVVVPTLQNHYAPNSSSVVEGRPPVATITCTSSDVVMAPVSSSSSAGRAAPLPLLSERAVGNRHGCLVFHKNDSRRKVAEVIFEKDQFWVEVAIDGGLKSYRACHLRVVPSGQFKEGDAVPSTFGKAPRRANVGSGSGSSPHKRVMYAKSPASLSDGNEALSVNYLFCWFCSNCGADNKMLASACHSCDAKKTRKSKRSILLQIAETSIEADGIKTVEEVINKIPFADRPSIPERVIANLLKAKTSGGDFSGLCLEAKDYSLEQKFYWCCGSCTMLNSYKRTTCSACLQGKEELAERSPLLKIAEKAALNSKTIDEALSLVSSRERPLMPKVVMDALVTCIYMIEGRNGQSRRCRKQKKEGYDYCESHCDPILLSQPRNDALSKGGCSIDSPSCIGSLSQASASSSKGGPRSRIAAISGIMPPFLREMQNALVNGLGWTINSIEDSVMCGENAAFPLGMKVRKFFDGYGFHDGRIIKVARKLWDDDNMKKQRPVLVYRLKYNDGDQEDFLHHEISSLREIYDKSNISPEAPPEVQIMPGTHFETRFGTMKIIGHKTPPEAMNEDEGGSVIIQFQDSSKDVELDLLKLQLAVLRKIKEPTPVDKPPTKTDKSPSSTTEIRNTALSSVLEWPGRGPNQNSDESGEENDQHYGVCEGLSLHRRRCKDSIRSPSRSVARFPTTSSVVDNPCDVRPGCNVAMWDPAGCFDHLSWDPYASTICEICGIDKDDNRVVICDECHSGFHTYCLRPVMVNIPNDEWICAACCGRTNTQISFEEYSENLRGKHYDILKYLGIHKKYKNPGEFLSANAEAIGLFSLHSQNAVKQRAISQQVQAKHVVFDVGNLKFIRAPEKNDWRLPTPLLSEEVYESSILSMAAAMQYCGMKSYSLDHIYSGNVDESMNDPGLEVDEITPMSKRNISIFQAYKHNTREGVFPPIEIIHDENLGFGVKALTSMPRHTIIGEYLGEVVTMEQSSQSNSDSLMVLLDTGDPKTSLIIDPTRAGNIARFLSGINNRSLMSKRKVNVRTRRFFMDGKVHICLFTSRRVEAGEILNYDYNAGNEGKDVDQWARTGFYDTSNFF